MFIYVIYSKIRKLFYTFDKAFAISNVPTVSILDAITGIPLYVCLELRNVISLKRSTWNINKISVEILIQLIHISITYKHYTYIKLWL